MFGPEDMPLFLILIAVTLTEIALFVVAGDYLSLWIILASVVVTALIGSIAMRTQGRQVLGKLSRLSRPDEAGDALLDGLLIVIAGVFLVTPGFLTDGLGLLLLVPQLRAVLKKHAMRHVVAAVRTGPGPQPAGNDDPFAANPEDLGAQHERAPSAPRKPAGRPMPDADDAVVIEPREPSDAASDKHPSQ